MSRVIKSAELSSESVLVGGGRGALTDEQHPILSAQTEQIVKMRLRQFEERWEAEKQQAYDRGFEEGKTQGVKLSEEKVVQAIMSFASVTEDLKRQQKKFFNQTEKAVLQLALAVAQRIIDCELAVNGQIVLNMVRRAIEHLVDKTNLLIKVSPEDLELIREHRQDWLMSAEGTGNLIIDADPTLKRGECVIETDSGQVNARIEKQLDVLKQAIMGNIQDE